MLDTDRSSAYISCGNMRRRPNTERLYELVGQKVGRYRQRLGLSQTQLAQRCDLARGSIANIESGNQRPTLHTLWSIAEALSVDMRSLLPSRDEYSGTGATAQLKSLPEGVAEDIQSQVVSFIASSREKIGANVDRD